MLVLQYFGSYPPCSLVRKKSWYTSESLGGSEELVFGGVSSGAVLATWVTSWSLTWGVGEAGLHPGLRRDWGQDVRAAAPNLVKVKFKRVRLQGKEHTG